MTVELRGHHLLCALSYASAGYDARFVARFDALIARLNDGEDIRIVAGPDDLCQAHADTPGAHCRLSAAARRDRIALRDLGRALDRDLGPGARLTLDAARVADLRARFEAGTIRAACRGCAWFDRCSATAWRRFAGGRLAPTPGTAA